MKATTLFLTAGMAVFSASPVVAIAADHTTPAEHGHSTINMFGGASYQGEPALAVTAASATGTCHGPTI